MADDKIARVHLELADGYRFIATFPDMPNAGAFTFDETPPLGGAAGPNPAMLLAAAIGNCLAASLTFCMRKARVSPARIGVDVAAHIVRTDTGRFRIGSVDVALSPETPEAGVAALDRCGALYEDFCIVTESVRHGIPVNVSLVPHASRDGAAA
jgi:organic hydroperoxide reductase OsmC/OhrA